MELLKVVNEMSEFGKKHKKKIVRRGKGNYEHDINDCEVSILWIQDILFSSSEAYPLNFTEVQRLLDELYGITLGRVTIAHKCKILLDKYSDSFYVETNLYTKNIDGEKYSIERIKKFYCINWSIYRAKVA